MTNDERLDEIKARLAAISPGPWRAQENHVFQRDGLFLWTLSFTVDESHNAAFIAAAPDDERWLVERVEALERENRLLRQRLEDK
jgi:hypothetical protein